MRLFLVLFGFLLALAGLFCLAFGLLQLWYYGNGHEPAVLSGIALSIVAVVLTLVVSRVEE